MKYFVLSFILYVSLLSCTSQQTVPQIDIDREELLSNLKTISSDAYEGRGFGTKGNKKAQEYITKKFKEIGVPSAFSEGYIQEFPVTIGGEERLKMYPLKEKFSDLSKIPDTAIIGGNIVTKINGKTDKTIVITGHHDHLGIINGQIYNGADDDASGTVALLAIADYFKEKQPNHTLVIAAVDAEEIGSPGCKYLVDHFPGDIKNVVLNINMDMIAHNDSLELYAAGLHHYPHLKKPLDEIKSPINLLYGHDDYLNEEEDDWTNSSDHRVFHHLGIPFIYFGVEDHKDYHKPSDTFENINDDFYIEAVKLIIQSIENYDRYLAK
ncbi:MAG: M28 family peptidase [Flavobacteriaceae bacterium]|nr:M28 family peptidase [Flavobacteriaceae bacterium]